MLLKSNNKNEIEVEQWKILKFLETFEKFCISYTEMYIVNQNVEDESTWFNNLLKISLIVIDIPTYIFDCYFRYLLISN